MTDTSEDLLGKAIIYQGSSAFPGALSAWLNSVVNFDNITQLAYFSALSPNMLYAEAKRKSVHANFERVYLAGAYLLDPFHDLHVSKAPRGVYRLNDIAPDQFQRNRYFRDYYRSTSLVDEMAFVAYPAEGISVHICLGRDSTSNTSFSSREIAMARQVSPVVVALAERQWATLNNGGAKGVEPDRAARLIAALKAAHEVTLSRRQAEVAMLILRGNSSASIGMKLGISPQTVKVFRKQLYRKCGISSQGELFYMMLPLLGE